MYKQLMCTKKYDQIVYAYTVNIRNTHCKIFHTDQKYYICITVDDLISKYNNTCLLRNCFIEISII